VSRRRLSRCSSAKQCGVRANKESPFPLRTMSCARGGERNPIALRLF